MIDLYTFLTPNGRKASIALEELGLPYQVHAIDISKGDQFKPEYLAVNPNNKIPAIVDREGPGGKPFTLWESGAILIYLAEKTGKLLSKDPRARAETIQWLMFQMSGIGPMLGQFNHFNHFAKEKIPYAIERYRAEGERLLKVLNQLLSDREFMVREFSIADIATYPWIQALEKYGSDLLAPNKHIQAWIQRVGERPAVKRGMAVPDLSKTS